MREMLYPSENPQVKRKSSIDQFSKYISTWKKGGYAPIVFDQIIGIGECSGIKSRPVVISWDPVGYVFPEAHCTYFSDRFITVDEHGVEQLRLPECFGEGFYEKFIDKEAFLNFDNDTSLGLHNKKVLRTGLDMVLANETLPPIE